MNVIFVLRHTWQVQDKPMANNVAYTSGKLSLHTDYPALHFAPGVSKILLDEITADRYGIAPELWLRSAFTLSEL